MNIKKKFQSIDQSQLSESQKEILGKIKTATKDFTITDEKALQKVDGALDNIIEKLKKTNPQAIKGEEKKEEAKPKKEVVKKEPKTETKTPKEPKKEVGGKRTIFSIAKEIRKADESWEEAKKRAKKVMEGEREETTKKMKTETDKLLAFIKRRKELEGLSGTSIKKDSKVEAMPKGRRISKKGWKNQYGESEGGKVYYENRDNRTDRLAPKFEDKIYLEGGGYAGGGYVVIAKSEKGGGFVMSKPSTKAKAEKLKSLLTKIDGETNEVMTVAKASKLSGLAGKEYLKYADGGTIIGIPETPLARGLDMDYTTLVGETGAMSSGELFEGGGKVKQNNFLFLDKYPNIDYIIDKTNNKLVVSIQEKGNEKSFLEIVKTQNSDDSYMINSVVGSIYNPSKSRWYGEDKYNFDNVVLKIKERYKLSQPTDKISTSTKTIGDFLYNLENYEPLIEFAKENNIYNIASFTSKDLIYTNTKLPAKKYYNVKSSLQPVFWSGAIAKILGDDSLGLRNLTNFGTVIGVKSRGNYGTENGFNNLGNQYLIDLDLGLKLLDDNNWIYVSSGGNGYYDYLKLDSKFIAELEKNSSENIKKIIAILKRKIQSYNKYADGGTIIGIPETPLARGLDMDYTTLVGETGAMSSGELFEGGGGVSEFSRVWDKKKLTRTTYQNGKYYTSEKFKSVEELMQNKNTADEVQKRREEKGRDKIKHTLKEFAGGGGVGKVSFEEWMKQNNIEVYKRTYYWVADDGKGDYLYSGSKADVMKSLREDWKSNRYDNGGYADKGVYVETLDEEIDLSEDGRVKAIKTQQGGNKSFGELREMHGASPEALAFNYGGNLPSWLRDKQGVMMEKGKYVIVDEEHYNESLGMPTRYGVYVNGLKIGKIVYDVELEDFTAVSVRKFDNSVNFGLKEFETKDEALKYIVDNAPKSFAEGGSLGNHGLKQGDQIIKTMSGGVQKVKTKSGDIVYVNLANGYRSATPPLPFDGGGAVKKI